MTENGKVQPVCDVCGKPATSMARDVALHEPRYGGFAVVRPLGPVKHGCDEHPAQSVEHRTGWPFQEPR